MTPTTGVDLSPILDPAIEIAGLVLTALAAWLSAKIASALHIQKTSTARTMLVGIVDNAIAYGVQRATSAADAKATVQLPSTQAAALQYVVDKAPATLKAVGIDPDSPAGQKQIADLITARLGIAAPPAQPVTVTVGDTSITGSLADVKAMQTPPGAGVA